MRWLEVRRHSLTKKGAACARGSHLSADGVTLARAVGARLGPFASVVTSSSPRAVETAIAMGFPVDDTVEMPSGYVPGEVDHHDQWRWQQPYVGYAELVRAGGGLTVIAEHHCRIWTDVTSAIPDETAALIVSHGGAIEPALVACLPDADHAAWGGPFGHCDGARLEFDGQRFFAIRFDRSWPDRSRGPASTSS